MMLYIFDMGGVVLQAFDVLPEAARRMGLSESVARQFAGADMNALMTGVMNTANFWKRFESRAGVHVVEEYWSSLFYPTVDAGMYALARSLHSSGRVVCGTNTVASHYDHLVKHGMYGCFDTVYASHLMGICKPDPAFWLAILEAEGVAARDAFFVDDYPENIEAAEKVGIRSHFFRGIAGLEAALSSMLSEPELTA